MKRKLFLSEFKRALIPTAVSLFTILLFVFLADRLLVKEAREGLNLFFGVVLVASGFVSGVRPFSSEFKTRHSLLLQTLPLRRGSVWCILVSANLVASLTCLAVVVMLHANLLLNPALACIGLVLYIFLFSNGCCYSLLHERPYIAYLAGSVCIALVVCLIATYAQYYSGAETGGSLITENWSDSKWQGMLYLCMVGLGFLTVLYFALSYRFFTAGEFVLWRTKLRNYATLVACVVIAMFVLNQGVPLALKKLYPWHPLQFTVSPDGQHLAILEEARNTSFARVEIVDTEKTTRVVALDFRHRTIRNWDFLPVVWSKSGDALTVPVAETSPLSALFHPASDAFQLISSAGKRLGRQILPGTILDMTGLDSGDILVATDGSQVNLLVAKSTDVNPSQLATFEDGWVEIRPLDRGALVLFSGESKSRAFIYDASLTALNYEPKNGLYEGTFLTKDRAYTSLASFKTEALRSYPAPRESAIGFGTFLLPGLLTRVPPVFYVDTDKADKLARLYVSTTQGSWKIIGDSIPVSSMDLMTITRQMPEGLSNLSVDWMSGVAVFLRVSADRKDLNVYDIARDSVTSISLPLQGQGHFVDSRIVPGSSRILIEISHAISQDESRQDGVYSFDPATGRLEEIKVESKLLSLLYRDEKGLQIFREAGLNQNRYFERVMEMDASGQKRQLWP